MRPAIRALAVLGLLASAVRPAYGAWPHDPYNGNVPVCTATGGQYNLASVPDGSGGVILAWSDTRSGVSYDIYAQRISAAGTPMWTANGLAVCTAANNQLYPSIASDGAGGAIIAWRDERIGANNDIYAQRVSAAGSVQWAANGIAICTAANTQNLPATAADGSGGAILAWADFRNGVDYDIYAQRVNAAGAVQWAANGVAVCTGAGGPSGSVSIAPDGAGGAIATWEDDRSGVAYDIYAQRVNSAGLMQWAANGAAICLAVDDQLDPSVVPDGTGGAIVAWQDGRTGTNSDIYARRISATGTTQWVLDGVALCTAAGDQYWAAMASDGAGGAIVAWEDARSGSWDVYAQRVTAAGVAQWTANGNAICTASGDQALLRTTPDGTGGAILAWQDPRGGMGLDICAQRVLATGTVLWPTNGAFVSAAVDDQQGPALVTDGAGGAIVAWGDQRASLFDDVYAQRIEGNGYLGNPEPVIAQVKDATGDQGGWVKVSWNASYLDAMPTFGVLDYRVWRSVPAASLTASALLARGIGTDPDEAAAGDRLLAMPFAGQDYAWEPVGSVAAALLPSYSLVAPTTRDSLAGSNPPTAFMIEARAGTSLSSDRWYSLPDSGYSVDNLAPAMPAPFTAQYAGGTTFLHWDPNSEPDLAGYRLYRGSSLAFVPDESSLVAANPDTGYVDAAGAPYVYKLTAVDVHGNESPVATVVPAGTTAVEGGVPPHAFFAIASANPVRSGTATTLRFGLAAAGRASVALYDAGGRRVRELAGGTREPGEHVVAWDGRDESGRAVAPGLYFARFEAPGFAATRKLVVQD